MKLVQQIMRRSTLSSVSKHSLGVAHRSRIIGLPEEHLQTSSEGNDIWWSHAFADLEPGGGLSDGCAKDSCIPRSNCCACERSASDLCQFIRALLNSPNAELSLSIRCNQRCETCPEDGDEPRRTRHA